MLSSSCLLHCPDGIHIKKYTTPSYGSELASYHKKDTEWGTIMKKHKKKATQLLAVSIFVLGIFFETAQAQNGSLKGKVVDGLNNSLVGQWVDIFDCTTPNPTYFDGYVASVKTSTGGIYEKWLLPGKYRVAVILDPAYVDEWYNDQNDSVSAECVKIKAEEVNQLQDMQLESAVTGSISGTVTGGGEPLNGVDIYAFDSKGNWITKTTDASGQYTISLLQTGYYTIYFGAFSTGYISRWYDNHDTPENPERVAVTAPDNTSEINAVLDRGGSISGKVTDSTTGDPIQNAWIDAYDKNLYSNGQPVWRGYAVSAADGSYTVKGLPSGEHKIEVFKAENTEPKEWYNNKNSFSSATPVPVNAEEETGGIDIALGPEPPTDLSQVYKLLLLKKRCTMINGVRVCR
jgi:protocatechuate 3,4-dioxygenase beta subunit